MTHMKKISREAIKNISDRTGLPKSIVRDMLWYGWTYSETINEPSTWIAPISIAKDFSKKQNRESV